MATDSTRLVIELEVLLRNLNRTLTGLNKIEQSLRRVASIRVGSTSNAQQRQENAAQRLANQQQRLSTQTQELANRQERARQASDRLALSQQRLTTAQQRATQASKGLNLQQDRHVQAFRAMQQASQQFNRTLNSLGNALRSVGQGFASFGATLSISVSAPLAALAVNVVDAAVRMDSLRRGLTTIAGSSQEAAVQLERLTEIAKLPGIGFEEAIQGSIALQAVGFSAQEAEKALVQFSNAVALTGGSREQLQTVTVQLGQMAAQSKILAADLKPIINAAPAVAVALRNAFGTTRSEEIQELGINSKEFIDILIKELDKLPRAAAGARNSFDNFRDTVFRVAAVIGESLLPALTRLADTFGPIITGLANAFAALPTPIQSTVLVVGALAIALGPFSFIFGQLITGLGRVIVGFAQLNAVGLLNISTFRLLGRVMIGTASLAQGAAATAAAAAVGWAALAGAVVAIVGIAAAIFTLSTRTKEHVETTEEQVRATEASLKVLRTQRDVLDKVTAETEAVTSASDELKMIYKSLNKESQGRVTVLQREVGLTRALKDEIGRLITVREGEQRIQAATTAAAVTTTAQQITTLGQQIDSTINRVERLRQAREELARTGRTQVRDPLLSSIASLDTARQIEQIDKTLQRLSTETLTDLRKRSDEATESLGKQNALLQQLEESTGKSTREVLEQAKAYGLFKGDVDIAAQGIEAFRKAQISLEAALSGTTEEVIRQRLELRKLSGPADEAQKQRRLLIDAAIDFAREGSNSIDEAKKKLDEFAEKFPEVRKAIEDEKRKGPIEEFLREFTGRKKAGRGDSGTSLRNARQQLADAITQVSLAQKEQEVQVEQDKNSELLQAAEVGQRLRIISYREYLQTRANLTADSLDKEIGQQLEVVKTARLVAARLAKEAARGDIGEAERTRRQAQSKQAEEEAIRAETRLIILRRERARIESELTQAIKESQDQQIRDTRQLEIQYAELKDKVADALKAATVEEFREQLEELGKAQDFLNKQIERSKQLRQREQVEELERARQLNQRQIDAIGNIIRQRDALAELAGAEAVAERAKQRQSNLEEQIKNDVELRGLSEERAIQLRLAGEAQLRAELIKQRDAVEAVALALFDAGRTVPKGLTDFIATTDLLIDRLDKLTFTEQFRLAEKEFQRLNDERLRRIADVERAVNNRNIAEAEGLLLIRQINGEYVGDLERQLALLKEIAAASNDANLQRQAQSAEETVKDANDQLASFGKQLRSTSIDSLRSGFIDFFQNLRDSTITAKERLLNLIDSVVNRINEVIAENLFDDLMASLFGGESSKGGILAGIKRLFGIEDAAVGSVGGVGSVVAGGAQQAADTTALATGAATAAATLQTGAVSAAGTLQAGAVAAATTDTAAATGFAAAITAAATGFAAAVTAAGATFAATVAAAAASQTASQAASGLAGALGGAATGLFPAVPGGLYKFVEGGYSEAVLTTDPKHASQQVQILRRYLAHTRNLWGRVKAAPGFAQGAFISRQDAESNLLSSLNFSRGVDSLSSVSLEPISSPPSLSVRNINLIDKRDMVRGYMRSAEGVRDIVNVISENAPEIGRRIGVK
jgi:tape measure domain-containing protein